MTLTTKDAAVLALLSQDDVPATTQQAMLKRLSGEAKKIAQNLTGGERGSSQVRGAAKELRQFSASLEKTKLNTDDK